MARTLFVGAVLWTCVHSAWGASPLGDIEVSGGLVRENEPAGTVVATFVSDAKVYRIMDAAGAPLVIVDDVLVTTGAFDFELTPSVAVRVRAVGELGLWRELTITIDVEDAPEPATRIWLDAPVVSEADPAGASLGRLRSDDPDVDDPGSWSIVEDLDQIAALDGDVVVLARALDFESADAHELVVERVDASGSSLVGTVVIDVADAPEAPRDLVLAGSDVAENAPPGAVVGRVSASDDDLGDAVTVGVVGPEAARFVVQDGVLVTRVPLDHEREPEVMVALRAGDRDGRLTDASVVVRVRDVPEAPSALALTPGRVAEGLPSGAPIGTLAATDPDSDSAEPVFELVADAGGRVVLVGRELVTGAPLDHEATPVLPVVVKAVDLSGRSVFATIDIAIDDIAEPPSAVAVSNDRVAAGLAPQRVGLLRVVDPDREDAHVLVVEGETFGFDIVDGALVATAPLAAGRYEVTLRAVDHTGLSCESTLTIDAFEVDDPNAPFALEHARVSEAAPPGTVVSAFTIGGAPPPAGARFELADDASAARFVVVGTSLVVAAPLDFEARADELVRVRMTAPQAEPVVTALRVEVLDSPEPPGPITLSAESVLENAPPETEVGRLVAPDPDAGGLHAWSIVKDLSYAFTIRGDRLITLRALDHEQEPLLPVTVRVTDGAGLTREATFFIGVDDVPEAPSAVFLLGSGVAENADAGSVAGTFDVSSDGDPDVWTFALDVDSSAPGAAFSIVGAELVAIAPLDFEAVGADVPLTVVARSARGMRVDGEVHVAVADVPEPPTGLVVVPVPFPENAPPGTVVAELVGGGDPDVSSPAYIELRGPSSEPAAGFAIAGRTVVTTRGFDHETEPRPILDVGMVDGSGFVDGRRVTLVVLPQNEPPSGVALSRAWVSERMPVTGAVGRVTVLGDPDAGHDYELALAGEGSDVLALDGDFLVVRAPLERAAVRPELPVTVLVTDHGDPSLVVALPLSVRVAPNAPPEVPSAALLVGEVNEDEAEPPGIALDALARLLDAHDPDDVDLPLGVLLSVSDKLVAGRWELVAADGAITMLGPEALPFAAQSDVRLRFVPGPDVAGAVAGTAFAGAWDGEAGSLTPRPLDITVIGRNDPPTLAVPPQLVGPAGVPIPLFTTSDGVPQPRIVVADVDAESLVVTLDATHGRLEAKATAGVTATLSGDGVGLALRGPVGLIQAQLGAIRFLPEAGFSGEAALAVTVSDEGSSGIGEPGTVSDDIAILLSPVAQMTLAIDGVELFDGAEEALPSVPVGAFVNRTYTITNHGQADLTLVDGAPVVVVGDGVSAWLTVPPPRQIAPEQSAEFVVTLFADAPGDIGFSLVIDPISTGVKTIHASARGVSVPAPTMRITLDARPAVGGDVIDFGTLPVIDGYRFPVEVENVGQVALRLEPMVVVRSDNNFAVQLDFDHHFVPPGESAVGSLHFAPRREGAARTVVAFRTNDPDEPTVVWDLRAEGIRRFEPPVAPTPPSATGLVVVRAGQIIGDGDWDDIGGVRAEQPVTFVYWLENHGTEPVALSRPTQLSELVGAQAALLAQPPELIAAGEVAPLPVTLVPTSGGPVSARLMLRRADGGPGTSFRIVSPGGLGALELTTLDGVIIPPDASASLPFVLPGQPLVQRYALRNAGTATVTLAAEPALVGGGPGASACVGARMIARWDIEPGAASELEVTLAPGSEPYGCELTFTSDDPAHPTYSVVLLGAVRGREPDPSCGGAGDAPALNLWLLLVITWLARRRRAFRLRRRGSARAGW